MCGVPSHSQPIFPLCWPVIYKGLSFETSVMRITPNERLKQNVLLHASHVNPIAKRLPQVFS